MLCGVEIYPNMHKKKIQKSKRTLRTPPRGGGLENLPQEGVGYLEGMGWDVELPKFFKINIF